MPKKLREIVEANFPVRPRWTPKEKSIGSGAIGAVVGGIAGAAVGGPVGMAAGAGAGGIVGAKASELAWKIGNKFRRRKVGWNEPSNIEDIERTRK